MAVRTTTYDQRRGAYYGLDRIDPRLYPGMYSVHWARFQSGAPAQDDPITTLTQHIAGGPVIASAGADRLTWEAAAGAIPAGYRGGATRWAEGASKADWNCLHANVFNLFQTDGPMAIGVLVTVQSPFAGESVIFQTNDETAVNIGTHLVVAANGGNCYLLAATTQGGGVSMIPYFPPNVGTVLNPDSLICDKPTLIWLLRNYGQRGWHGRGLVDGLKGYSGEGYVITPLEEPEPADSTRLMRLGNLSNGTGGNSSLLLHGLFVAKCLPTERELAGMSRFITETEGLEPLGHTIAEHQGYVDCVGRVVVAQPGLIGRVRRRYQRKRTQMEYNVLGTVEVEEESLDGGYTWTPRRVVAEGPNGHLGPFNPSLIDGVLYQAGGADAADPAYMERSLDGGGVWEAPIAIDGVPTSGVTFCEAPIRESSVASGELCVGVYCAGVGGSESKVVQLDAALAQVSVTKIGDGYECLVGRVDGLAADTVLAIYDELVTRRCFLSISVDAPAIVWSAGIDLGFGSGGRAYWLQLVSGAIVVAYRGGLNKRLEARYLPQADVAAGNWAAVNWRGPVFPDPSPSVVPHGAAVTYVHVSEPVAGDIVFDYAIEPDEETHRHCYTEAFERTIRESLFLTL